MPCLWQLSGVSGVCMCVHILRGCSQKPALAPPTSWGHSRVPEVMLLFHVVPKVTSLSLTYQRFFFFTRNFSIPLLLEQVHLTHLGLSRVWHRKDKFTGNLKAFFKGKDYFCAKLYWWKVDQTFPLMPHYLICDLISSFKWSLLP